MSGGLFLALPVFLLLNIMKEGENGLETLGFNSPSHNPENCRPNGDIKSHFVRKIKHVHIVKLLVSGGFSARSAIFCCHWGSIFSGRNNQAIGPRLSAIFTFF